MTEAFKALFKVMWEPFESAGPGTWVLGADGADSGSGVAAVVSVVIDHDLLLAVEAFLHWILLSLSKNCICIITTL